MVGLCMAIIVHMCAPNFMMSTRPLAMNVAASANSSICP